MRRILPLLLAAALLLSGCAAPYEEDPGVSWEEYQQSQTGQITEEAPQEEPGYPAAFSMASITS